MKGQATAHRHPPVSRSDPDRQGDHAHSQVNESGTYEGKLIRDQAAVTSAHTVNDRARSIR